MTWSIGRVSPAARKSATMAAIVSITGFERVALAGEGDPADQLARALIGKGVEHGVDHVALGGEALTAAGDRPQLIEAETVAAISSASAR